MARPDDSGTAILPEASLRDALGPRFRLVRRLGDGESGTSWLAVDREAGERRVVKAFREGNGPEGAADRIRKEGEALRSLSHPNVVRLREVVSAPDRGIACLVTDYVPGTTLLELAGRGMLPRRDVLDILVGCARALGALHRAGLVHGDLQPRNVVVKGGAGQRVPVLIDLGLSSAAGRRRPAEVTGTLGFLAPEVLLQGNPDLRADLYSLGALLCFLLSGEPPVAPEEILRALARGLDPFRRADQQFRGSIPAEFSSLLGRLLSRYPAARHQSASEVIEAVNLLFGTGYDGGSGESARPSLAEPPFAGRVRERRALLRGVLRARSGRGPRILVVEGPAGSGRSRLLREAVRLLEYRGQRCLSVRPSEGPAFAAVHAALREIREHLPPKAAAALAEAAAPGPGPEDEGEMERAGGRLLQVLRHLFSARKPPLLVLDGIAEVDVPSLRLLRRFLLDPARAVRPALVLAAFPEGGIDRLPVAARALAAVLDRPGETRRIPLHPFSVRGTDEFLRVLLPLEPFPVGLAEAIHERTGGLVAGIVDAAYALLEGDRIGYRSSGWYLRRPRDPLPVSRTAGEAARRRLEALGPAERTALSLLALAGGRATKSAWREVLRRAGVAAEAAASLESRGLVQEDTGREEVGIPSQAARDVLLDGTAEEKAARNGILADVEAAEGRGGGPRAAACLLAAGRTAEAIRAGGSALRALRLTYRLSEARALADALIAGLRGTPGAPGRAALYDEAARCCGLLGLHEEAGRLAREGLEGTQDPAGRRSLLLRLCEEEAALGRSPDALVAELRGLGPSPGEEARAELARARASFTRGEWGDAEVVLRGLLPRVGDDPETRLRLLAGLAGVRLRLGDMEGSEGLREESLRLAEEIGDATSAATIRLNGARAQVRRRRYRATLALLKEAEAGLGLGVEAVTEAGLHSTRVSALESLGKWRRAREEAGRAVALVEGAGLDGERPRAYRRMGFAAGMLGDAESAIRWMTRALAAATEASDVKEERAVRLALAGLFLDRGERDRAGALLEGMAGLRGRPGEFTTDVAFLRLEFDALDAEEALDRVRSLLGSPERNAWPSEEAWLRRADAGLFARAGRVDEAAARLEAMAKEHLRAGEADDLARVLVLLGTACATPGDVRVSRAMERARRLARRLENVALRAEVLEACADHFRAIPEREAFAVQCAAEAADLYGAASLAGRAESVEQRLLDGAVRGTWNGLRPEKLAWVLEQTAKVNEAEDPGEVLVALLDSAISFTGADRGSLVLGTAAGLEVRAARSMDEEDLGSPETSVSMNLLRRAVETGKPVLTTDAGRDERFSSFYSVRDFRLRSVLVVPIRRGAKVLGAFYLDNRFLEGVFREEDLAALEALASQAALAFENVSYRARIRDLNRSLEARVDAQEKELVGIRSTVRSIRRETKYAYAEIFRRQGAMAETLRLVDRAVDSEVSVLIEGESGTGKELVARAIHFHGPLKERPFVVVNCAAMTETLIESELFGHRKGAFTGATSDHKGQIEAANGGTLFLDEIGEISPATQVKLLRVLQFGEYTPVGSNEARKARFRLLAATNRDLRKAIAEGRFREDLYYRVAVFPVRVPPLRDRPQDIPGMAHALVLRFVHEFGRGPRRMSRNAVARLLEHDWPGNVRELENVLRRAVLTTPGDVIQPQDLAIEARHSPGTAPALKRASSRVSGGLRPREEMMVRRTLERGRISLREWVSLSGTSRATAARDLSRLVGLKVLVRRGRTASAYYQVASFRGR
jgi:transcriptional regulator with GAF, ATPase, and Fis domain